MIRDALLGATLATLILLGDDIAGLISDCEMHRMDEPQCDAANPQDCGYLVQVRGAMPPVRPAERASWK